MKKLRIILQSKILIVIVILITLLNVYVKSKDIFYNQNKLGLQKFSGTVKSIDDEMIEINDTIIYTDISNINLGDKVECIGEVSLPQANTNFNLFNYQKYLASKKIYYIMNGDCVKISSNNSLIYKIKNILIHRIEKMKSGKYINAFILGNTKGIDEVVNKNYRINGISHLFSISGMHVGFMVGILSFIKRKEIVALILLFYLILLGFPLSMTRAVFFYVLLLINKRTRLNISNLYLFVYLTVFMLWYNPYYIYNIGFVYSYIISFFLILLSQCLTENKYLKNSFKMTVIIFIITIPINIQNNFYLNFITPLLNLIFIPFVSFVLFPLSFVTLIFPFFDSGYNLICLILEKLSDFAATNLSLIYPFHKMNLMVFIGYYVIIIFIIHKIRFNEYKYIVLIIIILICHAFYPNLKRDGIVLMMDVGQGDSTLIIYPYNKLNILVDTGGYYSSKIVENITIPTLRSLGIRELDYLVLTHGDYDHAGETVNLLKSYKIKKVLLNSSQQSELELKIISYLDENFIPYSFVSNDIINDSGITLQFLNNGNKNSENDDSLVLYLNINNYKMIMMGDASVAIENYILNEYNLPSVDILKVGHHGSNTSSSKKFIDIIKPQVSIISAGRDNKYGHPHQTVLENLQLSDTYVTSINGAIKIKLGDSMLVQVVR